MGEDGQVTGATDGGFDEEGAGKGPMRSGHLVIRDYLKRLDDSPGVYRMLDAKGDVLYVGKARSLKKRVASYAKPITHDARIGRMVAATCSMMFLTTETETEALLLEQNLIKQLKPRYNVLLRDDKSFPAIQVTAGHAFPQIRKHRGPRKERGAVFRALRLGGIGEPHAEPAAEGVPAAVLLGFDVRGADAAVPAAPDQAVQRALRRADRARPTMP